MRGVEWEEKGVGEGMGKALLVEKLIGTSFRRGCTICFLPPCFIYLRVKSKYGQQRENCTTYGNITYNVKQYKTITLAVNLYITVNVHVTVINGIH